MLSTNHNWKKSHKPGRRNTAVNIYKGLGHIGAGSFLQLQVESLRPGGLHSCNKPQWLLVVFAVRS